MPSEQHRARITLYSGDESPDDLRRKHHELDLREVELVIRGPEGIVDEELRPTARLCGCRRVCIALIEPA